MIKPSTTAVFYDFNEEVVQVPLIQLAVWVSGLRLIVKTGGDFRGIEAVARRFLSTPDDYPVEDILDHLETVKKQTEEYYNIEE